MKTFQKIISIVIILLFTFSNSYSQEEKTQARNDLRLSFIGTEAINPSAPIWRHYVKRTFDPTVEYLRRISKKDYFLKGSVSGMYYKKRDTPETDVIDNIESAYIDVFLGIERQFKKEFWGVYFAGGLKYSNAYMKSDFTSSLHASYNEQITGFAGQFGFTAKLAKNIYLFWNASQYVGYAKINDPYCQDFDGCQNYKDWDSNLILVDGLGISMTF